MLAAGVCVLSLMLCSCGGDSKGDSGAVGTPRRGGELRMGLPADVISFDPLTSRYDNVSDGSRLAALYDVLLWTNPVTGSVYPQMAESMIADETDLNWELRLRPGIVFSDGTPLDAAAVRFNWDRTLQAGIARESSSTPSVKQIAKMSVDPADPLVLDIRLNDRNANFDRSVAKSLNFIASPTAIKQAGPEGLSAQPVGAGPFVVESYAKGQPLVLRRNERYWQADKGLPYLDKVTFVTESDVQKTIPKIKDGDLDMTVTVYAADLGSAQAADLEVDRLYLNGGGMIQFNTKAAPFKDRDARLAVAYALDGAEINEQVYHGKGVEARGLFSESSPLANIQVSAPQTNAQKATELFAKVTKNGTKTLEFSYTGTGSPLSEQTAHLIQKRLNAFPGVRMTINTVSIADYLAQVRPGQATWQTTVGQYWIDDPEPLLYDLLYSGSTRNMTGISSREIDNALTLARRTTDPTARRDAYTRVQLALNHEMPFWVYQEALAAAIFRSRVTGLQLFNDGLVLWDRIGLRQGE